MLHRHVERFFVIGAGRCGTTSVCDWLSEIPGVAMCDPKEPGFFCDQATFERGLSWYESLFHIHGETRFVGEGSVNYTNRRHCEETATRISLAFPDSKLIYITRNPLEQIHSNWRFSWMCCGETRGFSSALRECPTYLERCDYDWQLAPYRDCFSSRDIWVGFFEDLQRDENQFLESIVRFLGIDGPLPPLQKKNTVHSLRKPMALLRGVRNAPGFSDLRRFVPRALRQGVTALLHRRTPWPQDSEWTPELREWTLSRIAHRSRAFLIANQKEPALWEL